MNKIIYVGDRVKILSPAFKPLGEHGEVVMMGQGVYLVRVGELLVPMERKDIDVEEG